MGKGRKIVRSTENEAITPNYGERIEKSFVAPYGANGNTYYGLKRVTDDAIKELGSDMAVIDHSGQWSNERHARMMERDYIYPHERRVMGLPWDYQEAVDYKSQLELRQFEIMRNANEAEIEVKYGHLKKYFQPKVWIAQPENDIPFEEMSLGGDPEIVSESETNHMSPIFVSTGKVIKAKERSVVCSPMGDNGERKNLPDYAYSYRTGSDEFYPVNVIIPQNLPKEFWLEYCLAKII